MTAKAAIGPKGLIRYRLFFSEYLCCCSLGKVAALHLCCDGLRLYVACYFCVLCGSR